jgi:hypothetical protein
MSSAAAATAAPGQGAGLVPVLAEPPAPPPVVASARPIAIQNR